MDKLSVNDHIRILHFCLLLEIERKTGDSNLDVFNYDGDVDEMLEEIIQKFNIKHNSNID